MIYEETPAIDAMIEEFNRMKEGAKLLEEIWTKTGLHWDKPIPEELKAKIDNYFHLDDSE